MKAAEFHVLLFCVCHHEHAEHNKKDGACEHPNCNCNGYRGQRVVKKLWDTPERIPT